MNSGERLAFFYAVANAFVEFEADGVINAVFFLFAATAKGGESGSELFAIGVGDKACRGAWHIGAGASLGKKSRVVNDAFVAALKANALLELFFGLTGGNHGFGEEAPLVERFGALAEKKHPRGKFNAQFAQISRAAAAENFNALDDFSGMAGHPAERLVHIGDESDDFFAHALAGLDHDFGETDGIFFALHEGAGARFDVENESVNTFGKFFTHDGRADESDIFDGGGGVAEGVDFFVGWRDFGGLADKAHAAFTENTAKFFEGEIHVEAWNGFEFIERAAGVAEAAAADHRNGEAARCNDGRENERSFIADAAGGMLIHFFPGKIGEIDDFSGIEHGLGERGDLGTIQAAEPSGHEPGSHLVVGNFAARVAGDEEINLLARMFTGIAFFADQVDGAHA